jgi:hypothetical protein
MRGVAALLHYAATDGNSGRVGEFDDGQQSRSTAKNRLLAARLANGSGGIFP